MTTLIGIDLCLKIYGQEVNAGPLRDREKLESALAQPFQSFGGTNLYPTLIEKVARLTFGIAEAQEFQDGNKRLAWLIAMIFLKLNGVELDVDQDEAAHVIRALGARHRSCGPRPLPGVACATLGINMTGSATRSGGSPGPVLCVWEEPTTTNLS